jgi:ferredoxin
MNSDPRRRSDVPMGNPPGLRTEQCLNRIHRGAACRRCEAVCPVNAIEFSGTPTPRLSPELCWSCGACTAACPTQAWDMGGTAVRALTTTAANVESPLRLVCLRNSAIGSEPGSRTVEFGKCLAGLDAGVLLEVSRRGDRQLVLDTSTCDACPLATLESVIDATVTEVSHLLEAAGRDPVIRTGSSRETTSEHPAPTLRGAQVTRRNLFGLARTAWSRPESDTGKPLPRPVSKGAVAPSRLPEARSRLLAAMVTWSAPRPDAEVSTACTSFGSPEIDPERCSLCGLCAQFCPTEALALEGVGSDRQTTLVLTPTWCIDCGICAGACPEQAVTYGPSISLAEILERTSSPVMTDAMTPCFGCGLPTRVRPTDRDPLCYSCRHGTRPVTALTDGAGLMDDLLARIERVEGSPPDDG